MRAGRLDRTIVIQRSTETINPAGTPEFVWSTVATVRAELIETSAEEVVRSGVAGQVSTIFRTRFLDGVGNADRIQFDGAIYNIQTVREIGRRKGLELHASAPEAGS